MGFFSWHTNDTQEPIWNIWTGKANTVHMFDNQGNSWREDSYEGYGVFGGKDYYELLAEMNGLDSDRGLGISLAFSDDPHITPNLAINPDWQWKNERPLDHQGQGYWE